MLQDALRKESELLGRPFEQQMKEIDDMLLSRRPSLAEGFEVNGHEEANGDQDHDAEVAEAPVVGKDEPQDIPMDSIEGHAEQLEVPTTNGNNPQVVEPITMDETKKHNSIVEHTPPASTNGILKSEATHQNEVPAQDDEAAQPPTPPISTKGANQNTLGQGGIPWYIETFDPQGTTVYEDRWTGKDVLRDLSEELSDMDEEELQDLGVDDDTTASNSVAGEANGNSKAQKKSVLKKKRKGTSWTDRAFRTRRQR